jgi:hypothetical protein
MIEIIKTHGYLVFVVGIFVEAYYIHMYLKRIYLLVKPKEVIKKKTSNGKTVVIAPGKNPVTPSKPSVYIPSKDVDARMSGKIVDPFD